MKQFRKRMLATGLAVSVLACSTLPTIKVYATNEVNSNNFYDKEIQEFVKEGILQGYEDGSIRPNEKITRAEFIKITNKALGLTKKSDKTFKDVNKNDWFFEEISIAVGEGYIDGFEDNTFRPNEEITREQMAKIVAKILDIKKEEGHTGFKDDNEIASWAKPYIKALKSKGILSGYPTGEFKPKESATRKESVYVIKDTQISINNSNKDEVVIPSFPPVDSGDNENKPEEKPPVNGGDNGNKPEEKPPVNGGDNGNKPEEKPPVNGGDNGSKPEEKPPVNGGDNGSKPEEKPPVVPPVNKPEVDKPQDLQNSLSDPTIPVVEYKGTDTITESLEVPAGKTLKLSNDVSINSNVEIKGNLVVDKNIVLDNGGKIVINDTTRSKTNPTISGEGIIEVKEGSIEVKEKDNLNINLTLTNKSDLKIGNEVLLSKDLKDATLTLRDDTTKVEFKLNQNDADKNTIVVDGNIKANKDIDIYTLKSNKEGSTVEIVEKEGTNTPVKVNLNGTQVSQIGTYKSQANGSWSRLENIRQIQTKITTANNDSLIVGDVELKGKILPILTMSSQTGDKFNVDILDENGDEIVDKINLEKRESFLIRIQVPSQNKVTGIKINEKIIKLDKVIEPYTYVYLNVGKDDYKKLGLDTLGNGLLEVELIETNGNLETYTKGGVYVEDIVNAWFNPIDYGFGSSHKVTPKDVTVSNEVNTQLTNTLVEFLVNGESVRAVDLDTVTPQDKLELKVHLAKDAKLNHIMFLNKYIEVADQDTFGKTVTITFTDDQVKELCKDLMGTLQNLQMTIFLNP